MRAIVHVGKGFLTSFYEDPKWLASEEKAPVAI